MIGTEHMKNNTMFTLSHDFYDLNKIVDSLRKDNRAAILKFVSVKFKSECSNFFELKT